MSPVPNFLCKDIYLFEIYCIICLFKILILVLTFLLFFFHNFWWCHDTYNIMELFQCWCLYGHEISSILKLPCFIFFFKTTNKLTEIVRLFFDWSRVKFFHWNFHSRTKAWSRRHYYPDKFLQIDNRYHPKEEKRINIIQNS